MTLFIILFILINMPEIELPEIVRETPLKEQGINPTEFSAASEIATKIEATNMADTRTIEILRRNFSRKIVEATSGKEMSDAELDTLNKAINEAEEIINNNPNLSDANLLEKISQLETTELKSLKLDKIVDYFKKFNSVLESKVPPEEVSKPESEFWKGVKNKIGEKSASLLFYILKLIALGAGILGLGALVARYFSGCELISPNVLAIQLSNNDDYKCSGNAGKCVKNQVNDCNTGEFCCNKACKNGDKCAGIEYNPLDGLGMIVKAIQDLEKSAENLLTSIIDFFKNYWWVLILVIVLIIITIIALKHLVI
jgi:hypothetical protein